MAGSFTTTGSYSNLTRLELEQLRKADFYAGLKALTVGDSALPPEGVVGKGDINAEPYLTGPTISLRDVMSITPPARPGSALAVVTNTAQVSGGLSAGVPSTPPTTLLKSTAGSWFGPQQVVASSNGTTALANLASGTTVNGLTTVSTASSLVGNISPGMYVTFTTQAGVYYLVQSVSDAALTLASTYLGTGGSATVATTSWNDTGPVYGNYLGPLNLTNSSSAVPTYGIDYTASVHAGDAVIFSEQTGVYYVILTITSTTITLTASYTGASNATASGVAYVATANGNPDTSVRVGDILAVTSSTLNANAVGTVSWFDGNQSLFLTDINSGFVPTGTFHVTNSSNSVTTSLNQVGIVAIGSKIVFASQPGVAYQVSGVSSSTITLSGNYMGSTNTATAATGADLLLSGTNASYVIIRPGVVQLFAVPGSGPTGSEQSFMAVVPGSALHTNVAPTVNQINADRVPNIVPAQYGADTTVDRSDSIYDAPGGPRTSLDKLGYRVVLYPDNGSGLPNMAAPITTLSPVIDPSILSTDQRFTVDGKAGIIRFSCAPKLGGQIKVSGGVNGTTGRLNLYATFWAMPEAGSALSNVPSVDNGTSAGAASSLYSYSPSTGYTFQTLAQILQSVVTSIDVVALSNFGPEADGTSILSGSSGGFNGFLWDSYFQRWIANFEGGSGVIPVSYDGGVHWVSYGSGNSPGAGPIAINSANGDLSVWEFGGGASAVQLFPGSSGIAVNGTGGGTSAFNSSGSSTGAALYFAAASSPWQAFGSDTIGTTECHWATSANGIAWTDNTSALPSAFKSGATTLVGQLAAVASPTALLLAMCGVTAGTDPAHIMISTDGSTATDVTPSVLTGKVITGLHYTSTDGLFGLLAYNGSNSFLYVTATPATSTSWTLVKTFTGRKMVGVQTLGHLWLIGGGASLSLVSGNVAAAGAASTWGVFPFSLTAGANPTPVATFRSTGSQLLAWNDTKFRTSLTVALNTPSLAY